MAKNRYSISLIRNERESDYFDFWEKGLKVNKLGESLHSDLVGFEVIVEASNLQEAISIVKEKHPCSTIVERYSSKVG
ncbi:hypothetical protein PO654_26425 [Phytobacter diazotrophicus]|uniref:Uncharacterized protein n=1 Tax=Phytobacter ursingii TaxID=1972431 RepID=A0AB35RUW7_9ENTR|nr:hypothetical protein [Phytobacter ursingii]AUU93180.1 hypothetical protein C2U55_29430 [Enterobacteriaceae bacterium ENNIH3]MDU4154872.1 hypothetical protein [Enterobacteriaceae bacterium]QIH66825.1 hypothetical protein CRX67_28040 [Enterobacteriaceae bacterium A-F18]MDV2865820.1 hypothetical protein [Phytobacter ursingii]VTP13886.1 hypothetical protein PUATCC27989T_01735 [Phytobacter ursingii]